MYPKIYLAYGSNLNLTQMAHRCPTATILGTGELKDYRLLFRGRNGMAVATVEPCKGASVPVLLWAITAADEASLDIYEGHPRLYRKETVKVKLNRRKVEAMMYVMNEGRPLGKPSPFYYNTILEGYEECEFDARILEQGVTDSMEGNGND